ncbi:hypothetical protein V8G54_011316 [Vigna mungo]|uniref:Uncharacterized protein n=1 Tax=Vigna mungo TaxID=3915 RepID=A0AAQ3NR52_VIGMU
MYPQQYFPRNPLIRQKCFLNIRIQWMLKIILKVEYNYVTTFSCPTYITTTKTRNTIINIIVYTNTETKPDNERRLDIIPDSNNSTHSESGQFFTKPETLRVSLARVVKQFWDFPTWKNTGSHYC